MNGPLASDHGAWDRSHPDALSLLDPAWSLAGKLMSRVMDRVEREARREENGG